MKFKIDDAHLLRDLIDFAKNTKRLRGKGKKCPAIPAHLSVHNDLIVALEDIDSYDWLSKVSNSKGSCDRWVLANDTKIDDIEWAYLVSHTCWRDVRKYTVTKRIDDSNEKPRQKSNTTESESNSTIQGVDKNDLNAAGHVSGTELGTTNAGTEPVADSGDVPPPEQNRTTCDRDTESYRQC